MFCFTTRVEFYFFPKTIPFLLFLFYSMFDFYFFYFWGVFFHLNIYCSCLCWSVILCNKSASSCSVSNVPTSHCESFAQSAQNLVIKVSYPLLYQSRGATQSGELARRAVFLNPYCTYSRTALARLFTIRYNTSDCILSATWTLFELQTLRCQIQYS